MGNTTQLLSSKNQSWQTPQWLFDRVCRDDDVVVDLAAAKGSQKVTNYITPEENSLTVCWRDRIFEVDPRGSGWLNPPYGRQIAKWAKKSIDESRDVPIILLVAARTDTQWFRNLAANGIVGFLPGRLHFDHTDGQPAEAATFPSALIWLGPRVIPCVRWLDWRDRLCLGRTKQTASVGEFQRSDLRLLLSN